MVLLSTGQLSLELDELKLVAILSFGVLSLQLLRVISDLLVLITKLSQLFLELDLVTSVTLLDSVQLSGQSQCIVF